MKQLLFLTLMFLLFSPCAAQESKEPNQLYPVQIKGRYGYVNINGEMVIPPRFDAARKFHNGLALVRINGKNISEVKDHYDYIGGDFGYIDKTGKFVIEAKYDIAEDFSEGLACVWINLPGGGAKFGYIDTTGKTVIKGQFQTAGDFINGTADVRLANGKWGVIDKTGKFIIQPVYDEILPFIEDVGIAVTIANKKASPFDQKLSDFETVFFDRTGKIITRPAHFVNGWFSEGLVSFIDEDKKRIGFMDKTGQTVIEPQFERALGFLDGLCPVRVNKKWGYIDKTGNFVIPAQYNDAYMFSEGLGKVVLDDKTGFIDKTGKMVIAPQEWEVSNFEDGLAYVRQNSEKGLIDKTGKFIWNITE